MAGGAAGPLVGLRVVEFAGIGPGPYATMLLADLGAEVLRIDRPGGAGPANPVVDRGRALLTLDLRSDDDRGRATDAVATADVLIEGFRPGVMERLGLGPDAVRAINPRLVYGRMTGWGQTGPLATAAGHDINYLALTGALAAIGRPGEPATPPLNLVGDFGGGSMLLVLGILAALVERERSGLGQVIDAAIVDGASSLMAMFAGFTATGRMSVERDANFLAGSAPFYRCYLCADGREIAVGAIEARFYEQLLAAIEAPRDLLARQHDRRCWAEDGRVLAALFARRPAADWAALLEGGDCCAAAVVTLAEAPAHPHLAARGTFVEHDGLIQVAPVPRFSRTPGAIQGDGDAAAMLARWRAV